MAQGATSHKPARCARDTDTDTSPSTPLLLFLTTGQRHHLPAQGTSFHRPACCPRALTPHPPSPLPSLNFLTTGQWYHLPTKGASLHGPPCCAGGTDTSPSLSLPPFLSALPHYRTMAPFTCKGCHPSQTSRLCKGHCWSRQCLHLLWSHLGRCERECWGCSGCVTRRGVNGMSFCVFGCRPHLCHAPAPHCSFGSPHHSRKSRCSAASFQVLRQQALYNHHVCLLMLTYTLFNVSLSPSQETLFSGLIPKSSANKHFIIIAAAAHLFRCIPVNLTGVAVQRTHFRVQCQGASTHPRHLTNPRLGISSMHIHSKTAITLSCQCC